LSQNKTWYDILIRVPTAGVAFSRGFGQCPVSQYEAFASEWSVAALELALSDNRRF
jgi:hypothetical protein